MKRRQQHTAPHALPPLICQTWSPMFISPARSACSSSFVLSLFRRLFFELALPIVAIAFFSMSESSSVTRLLPIRIDAKAPVLPKSLSHSGLRGGTDPQNKTTKFSVPAQMIRLYISQVKSERADRLASMLVLIDPATAALEAVSNALRWKKGKMRHEQESQPKEDTKADLAF